MIVLKDKSLTRNILLGISVIVLVLCIGLFIKNKTYTLNTNSINKESVTKELDKNLIGAYIQNGDDYTSTNEIPTSGYEFNEEKSYCKIGEDIQESTTLSYDINTQTLTVSPITKEGMKCYLYFDEKASGSEYILAQEGGAEEIEAKGTPDFSKIATTDEGMYAAEDDYGTSYYYRGAVNDNWLQFGGFYWRIIRINGNGSIRMIYSGSDEFGPITAGEETTIGNSQAFNRQYEDTVYIGYMYQTGQTHGTIINSTIKNKVDQWYKSNLITRNEYLDENAGFCGDRTSTSKIDHSRTVYYYGSYTRLKDNKLPSFKCPDKKDLYTIVDSANGNKALQYSIELISADEVAFAGGVYGTNNENYYLFNNTHYWTISPSLYDNSALVMLIYNGGISDYKVDWGTSAGATVPSNCIRPVINLKSDVQITGSGTTTDPFKVVGAD